MSLTKYSLEYIKYNFIVFGDSHSWCFRSFIQNTNSFPASSAKGLGNPSSRLGVNNKIKNACATKYSGYIFYFGKVDMDFILTHILNTNPDTDFKQYLDAIIYNYINFIKGLCLENVYICELAINHLSDTNLLLANNMTGNHHNTNKNLDDKYTPMKYTKVLPLDVRNEYILYFNKQVEQLCNANGYTLLNINNTFLTDTGEYRIPDKYLHKDNTDHHLVEGLAGESYLKNIVG